MASILSERARVRDASERFTWAIELLSAPRQSDKLAGIYALDGLMRESNDGQLQGAVIEVLSAFVRRQAHYDVGFTPIQKTSAEVQAALTTLSRAQLSTSQTDRPLDLHGIALREAYLPLCYLERAFLYDCDLEGALLMGAHLRGAWLARCNLTRANLDKADLRGADLTDARGLVPENLDGVLWDADTRWP